MSNIITPRTFKADLAAGLKAEVKFKELYPSILIPSEERGYDFLTEKGKKVELKTDSYDMKKTANFFMERYSDIYKKNNGGPWRAHADAVDVFIYWFPTNKVWFEFHNLKELIKVLDDITEKMYIMRIKNQAWITGGFKVPRDLLVHHYRRCEHG